MGRRDADETEASPPEDDLVALVDAYDAGPGLEKYRHYFEVYERHLAPFRLDDGGHGMRQQIGTFEFLYPRLAAGGVYVVEDCHTSYWPSFGGDGPRSFMEFVKRKMDALHYFHLPVASDARARLSAEDVAFARETKAISVFESVVVFEKRRRRSRRRI
ncbi:hypothetical protein JL722_221 [Aureococcus anophagefferens]|nr:hypothetical protein JL722_221 [Aureococcus anophagefferens]